MRSGFGLPESASAPLANDQERRLIYHAARRLDKEGGKRTEARLERSRAGADCAGPAEKTPRVTFPHPLAGFPSSARASAFASRQLPVRVTLTAPPASLLQLSPSRSASRPSAGSRTPHQRPRSGLLLPASGVPDFSVPPASSPDRSVLLAAFAPFGVAYRTSRGKTDTNSQDMRVSRSVDSQNSAIAQGNERLAVINEHML